MERVARARQEEHGTDDDAEAATRLWSQPAVDALLSSLTHVRTTPQLRILVVAPQSCRLHNS